MAEQEEKSASIPWLPLITLIGVGSGVLFFSFQQLISSRPGGGDPRLAGNTFDEETIDARLWQDPLGVAIADGEKQRNSEVHSVRQFQKLLIKKWFTKSATGPLRRSMIYPLEEESRFTGQAEHVQILAVMIPGGPYVEDVERRLRSRRAVIEGLGTSAYAPEKDHEIGYFSVPWQPLEPNVVACVRTLEKNRNEDERPVSYSKSGIQPARIDRKKPDSSDLLVPYEWCELTASGNEKKTLAHVLVLWLTDSAFRDAPLGRLADLISWFRLRFVSTWGDGNLLRLPTFTVLGPDNSGTLNKMVIEAQNDPWNNETRQCLATTHIYSSQASAAESQLLSEISSVGVPRIPIKRECKYLIERNVKGLGLGSGFRFDRTNLLDDQIVDTLWRELKLRGVKDEKNDHVVIISEEDTYYARALSSTFTESQPKAAQPFDVRRYTYLRGIDGKLPSDEKDEKEKKGAAESSSKNTQSSSRPTERTEGLNQADDIRRLTAELRELDEQWRAESGGQASLKAVGLLGSDVYDKLELLKALRPVLPEAVFFTNHLDARLAHPDEWKETHNLVVVSAFRLSINESLNKRQKQRYQNVAPFRDSGQTALYEATLESMGKVEARDAIPNSPLIFEIGRYGPKELSISGRENTIAEFFELIRGYLLRISCFVA
ncbi:MAG TPA: hypothetical protein VN857_05400, partial [Chthoniobacterales bacterium]|nr:hypothetical protein [Chthoniobacterales bacterium]